MVLYQQKAAEDSSCGDTKKIKYRRLLTGSDWSQELRSPRRPLPESLLGESNNTECMRLGYNS